MQEGCLQRSKMLELHVPDAISTAEALAESVLE